MRRALKNRSIKVSSVPLLLLGDELEKWRELAESTDYKAEKIRA